MKKIESSAIVYAMLLLLIFICHTHGESNPYKKYKNKRMLGMYLVECGKKYDYYFTIEEIYTGKVPINNVVGRLIEVDSKIETIEGEIEHIKRSFTDLDVNMSEGNKRIIHIIERRTNAIKGYPLQKKINEISYSGVLGKLQKKIGEMIGGVKWRDYGIAGSVWGNTDLITKVEINAKNISVRDLITDYVPIFKYWRIIWISTYDERTSIAEVRFLGRRYTVKPAMDFKPNLYSGEGKWGYEKSAYILEKSIENAIGIVRAHDDPRNMRMAILLLGRFRAVEAVEVLLERIDYMYTDCRILEEKHPAVRALCMIGRPVTGELLEFIPHQNRKRAILMAHVLRKIEGKEAAISMLERLHSNEKDQDKKKRLMDCIEYASSIE